MTHQGYIKILDEKIEGRIDVLSRGTCDTLEKYTHACGEILGLRSAKAEYLEMLKTHDPDDEELDGKSVA